MALLIDREGRSRRSSDNTGDEAVWKLGFIAVCQLGRSIVVSLNPRLVSPATLAGAFYLIADQRPESIVVCVNTGVQRWFQFFSIDAALEAIETFAKTAESLRELGTRGHVRARTRPSHVLTPLCRHRSTPMLRHR